MAGSPDEPAAEAQFRAGLRKAPFPRRPQGLTGKSDSVFRRAQLPSDREPAYLRADNFEYIETPEGRRRNPARRDGEFRCPGISSFHRFGPLPSPRPSNSRGGRITADRLVARGE